MIFSFILIDQPDTQALRHRLWPEHKACLGLVGQRMGLTESFVADDGQILLGRAIDSDSRDAAPAWLADEPFTRAGLYASTTVQAFVNLWPQNAGFAPQA